MKKIVNFFLEKLKLEKNLYGYFEGWLSIFINSFLFFWKYYFGVITGSIALKTDAFHTLSDVVTSGLVILGFYISRKPPDEKHPFGHGRSEKISSIIMATLLIVVAYEFFVASFKKFISPTTVKINLLAILVLVISIFFKEFLYSTSIVLYKKSKYHSLKADAWHHRSDSFATFFVIVGFFIFKFGLMKLDGILGMLISLLIGYTGFSLIKEVGSILIGETPSLELRKKIEEIVKEVGGEGLHHIHIHDYSGKLEITLHIRMKSHSTLEDTHKFATLIETSIQKQIPNCNVTVHCEPV